MGLLPPGSGVVVGFSGGPDSLALLHALAALQPGLNLRLVAAHLDHMLRPESAGDAERAGGLAAALGVPFVSRAVDVRRRVGGGESLESSGRTERYQFFAEVAAAERCAIVVVGHTADDQAETVLLHLLRGTGLAGLAGMPAQRPLSPTPGSPLVVRPLLTATRDDVLAYCAAHELEPLRDPTNDSPTFRRNRVRHELLPLLAAQYNPRIAAALARLAETVRGEVELRDQLAAALLERAALPPRRAGQARLNLDALSEAPRSLALAALRLGFRLSAGPELSLDHAATTRLERLLEGGYASAVDLLGGWTAFKFGSELAFVPPGGSFATELEAQPLPVPSAVDLSLAGVRIDAAVVPPPAPLPSPPEFAYLDADAVRGCLTVRPPWSGARFQPLGMTGSKKVHDLLSDRKVPRFERGLVPVVTDEEKVLWVAGHAIDRRARVTAETRRVLRLRVTSCQ